MVNWFKRYLRTERRIPVAFAALILTCVFTSALQYEVEKSSVWYRPAHFLYVYLLIAVLCALADSRGRSKNRRGVKILGLTALGGVFLWASELVFDFRLGYFTAPLAYLIPAAIYEVHHLVRRALHRTYGKEIP